VSLGDVLAIPDLLAAKNVLCVQPHYDDNDIAAGGTIALLKARGARVTYVTVTDDLVGVVDDDLTDEQATRALKSEQLEAGEIIGVAEQHRLGYPDAGRYDHFELRLRVIRHIRRVRPDFVLTCDPWLTYEALNDHVACGKAVAEAVLLQAGTRRLPTDPETDGAYSKYEVTGLAFYFTSAPNLVVDIGAYRETKHRAMDLYRTQFTDEGMQFLHAAIEHKERDWAKDHPFEHGEAFKVLRPVMLHCNVDAARM
jgi:N,N'-diacetylchitobiose non-reducing end deacetylase